MTATTIKGPDGKLRCRWSAAAPEFIEYHDKEWGFPVDDDHRLFEKLCLEGFQSGLSWRTILAKRESFRAAFQAALNMAGRSLAHDLKPDGVAVLLLHPGWVRTDMTSRTGNIDASEAARGLIQRLDALTLAQSGSFLHQDGQPLPW